MANYVPTFGIGVRFNWLIDRTHRLWHVPNNKQLKHTEI